MEKGIRELSFTPGGVGSMIQVIDLKDSSITSMKELRHIIKRLCDIIDNNYPEFVGQHVSAGSLCRAYVISRSFIVRQQIN